MFIDPLCLVLLKPGFLIHEFSFQRHDVDGVSMVHLTDS